MRKTKDKTKDGPMPKAPQKKYRKPPASRSLITPEKVRKFAATRMPIPAIAATIGVSAKSIEREMAENESIQAAFKEGRALASAALATQANERLEQGHPTVTAMALKQPVEHGGLGWMDERSMMIRGQIDHKHKHTVSPSLLAWNEWRDSQNKKAEVIEIEAEGND